MAIPQTLQRTARGLHSQFNPIYTAPEGAQLEVDNCVIDREGITSKRRGFDRYGDILTTGANALMDFMDTLIVLDGTTLKYDSDGAGTWISWSGTFNPPDANNKARFVEARSNLYFTTSVGIYKNDALTNSPVLAGMPKGLDMQLTLVNSGSGWFAADQQIGYRIVFTKTDANAFLIYGAPSERDTLVNPSAGTSDDVQVVFTLPDDVIAGDFYEIYRTQVSASETTDPGDRHLRVVRRELTSGDISTGTVTYTDVDDDSFLGQELYTNTTQETISQASTRPPFATDITLWKGHTWYANIKREHQIDIRLLSIPAVDDVFVITSGADVQTYTAKDVENIASGEFKRETSGTVAENLRNTAKSLIRVINRRSANTEYESDYISGVDDPPGKVLIRRIRTNQSAFSLTATTSTDWEPALPSSGSTVSSTDSGAKNVIAHSKFESPESVPTLNTDPVGSEQSEILRILPLRDSLIILKEEGVWRLSGESETNFVIKSLDPSTRLLAPETAVVLNNAVWCLSNQGIVRIDESGTAIVSRTIEPDINKILSFDSYKTLTHAVSYESERKYILWSQDSNAASYAKVGWVYNYLTQSWSLWTKNITNGLVLFETDKMFLSHANDKYILQERKTFATSNDDYRDEGLPATITIVSTTTNSDGRTVSLLTLNYVYAAETLSSGWLFEQGIWESGIASVTDNGSDSYTIELDQELSGVTTGACVLSTPITSRIRWVPEEAGNPTTSKHFTYAQVYMEENTATENRIGTFTNAVSDSEITNTITIEPDRGWGLTPWGLTPFGDHQAMQATPLRVPIPRQHQRAQTLSVIYTHAVAKENFNILSLGITVRPYSSRTVRTPA